MSALLLAAMIAAGPLPGGPNATVCRTPSCGGPSTAPLPCPDPCFRPDLDSTAVLLMGGVDPNGNVREILTDREGRVVCSPRTDWLAPKVTNDGLPVSVYVGTALRGQGYSGPTIRVDEQGRVECAR